MYWRNNNYDALATNPSRKVGVAKNGGLQKGQSFELSSKKNKANIMMSKDFSRVTRR